MRRVLIDHARRRKAMRRGGDFRRVPLDDNLAAAGREDWLIAADDLVDQLAAYEPVVAELAKLHIFTGLSVEEAGAALGISPRTAYRKWAFARAWLSRKIRQADPVVGANR